MLVGNKFLILIGNVSSKSNSFKNVLFGRELKNEMEPVSIEIEFYVKFHGISCANKDNNFDAFISEKV